MPPSFQGLGARRQRSDAVSYVLILWGHRRAGNEVAHNWSARFALDTRYRQGRRLNGFLAMSSQEARSGGGQDGKAAGGGHQSPISATST